MRELFELPLTLQTKPQMDEFVNGIVISS